MGRNSAVNSSLKADLQVFLGNVFCSMPKCNHSQEQQPPCSIAFQISNTRSQHQQFWTARMPQESQISSFCKVHAHRLQFAPTAHTMLKICTISSISIFSKTLYIWINSSKFYPDPLTLLVQMLPGHVQSGLLVCSGSEIFPMGFLRTKLGRQLWQLWQQLPPKKAKEGWWILMKGLRKKIKQSTD